MFSKANLISTLATAIWGFFGGYLLWGIIADPILMNHLGSANVTSKEMPDMMYLAVGCVLTGLFFSTLFSKYGSGSSTGSKGFQYGILIGLLLGFGNGIIDFSTVGILDLTGTLINGIIYVIHFAIMGVIAGVVYQKFSS